VATTRRSTSTTTSSSAVNLATDRPTGIRARTARAPGREGAELDDPEGPAESADPAGRAESAGPVEREDRADPAESEALADRDDRADPVDPVESEARADRAIVPALAEEAWRVLRRTRPTRRSRAPVMRVCSRRIAEGRGLRRP